MERVRGRRRRTNNYQEEEAQDISANYYVSSSFIPDHPITEILLRTPASSVLRFKSVCKQWCSIIKDPQFIRKHFDYLRKNPLVSYALIVNGYSIGQKGNYYLRTVEEEETEEAGLTWLADDHMSFADGNSLFRGADDKSVVAIPETWFKFGFKTMWECNGLLCFFSWSRSRILISNPTTKTSVTLPVKTGNSRPFGVYGFGYDAVNRQYKVVQLTTWVYNKKEFTIQNKVSCNVFTLGDGSKSWRTVPLTVNRRARSYSSSMHVDGSVYWLIENMADDERVSILCFDVGEEKLRLIKLPSACKLLRPGDIAMVGGLNERRFGIVNFRSYNAGIVMDIWMLNEDSTSTIQGDLWVKEYCNIRMRSADHTLMRKPMRIMNNKLFLKTVRGIASYDLQDKRIGRGVMSSVMGDFEDGDVYMQNMMSLHDLMKPQG